jgi:hypothetical protein
LHVGIQRIQLASETNMAQELLRLAQELVRQQK